MYTFFSNANFYIKYEMNQERELYNDQFKKNCFNFEVQTDFTTVISQVSC